MRSTPQQVIRRDRFEALIGLMAPALDLILNAGEQVSRLIAPEDRDYYPIRPADEAFEIGSSQPAASPAQVD